MEVLAIRTDSADKTRRLGERLGRILAPGDILCVHGTLGAGKTVLAQGVARGLGVAEKVTSPTFILIREYQGRLPFYHFDAYRLEGAEDFALLGYEEYFFGEGVVFVEWADRVSTLLPDERLDIYLERNDENERRLEFNPRGARYRALVKELNEQ
jgi:tRNA threonylcarbamoyladenosine biosynthesis protein TsaE